MDDHTISLLKECNSGCKMAVGSLNQIEEAVTDIKLKKLIRAAIERHRDLEDESCSQLAAFGEEGKSPEPMAAAMSWLTTEMKLLIKNDDKQAAKLLMDGANMGVQSLCGYKNQYTGASKESILLADKLIRSEEELSESLKPFL